MSDFHIEYTMLEARQMLEEVIDTTLLNLQNGIKESLVYSLIGDNGIGKTDMPKQIAKERGMMFHQIDIPQLDDLVALVGYPTKVFEMAKVFENDGKKEKKVRDVDHSLVDFYTSKGWLPTGKEPSLSYAKPEWVSKLERQKQGSILVFNDYTRALPFVIQAVMELVQNREYNNWRLPDNCVIFCSENPDNGRQHVAVADDAQNDRIVRIPVKYDEKAWAKWAENAQVKGECINFMLADPTPVLGTPDGEAKGISPRRWTKLFRMIQNLPEFRSKESLAYIQKHGAQIVGNHINTFTTFLNNGLYQIISPADIMDMKANPNDVVKAIQANVKPDGNNMRTDISAMLGIRLKNYLQVFAKENDVNKDVIDRLEIVLSANDTFHSDTVMNILDALENDKRFVKLLQRESIYTMFNIV